MVCKNDRSNLVIYTFRPKRGETKEWRRLHNKKLLSLYRSSSIVRVIKSRRLGWAGHVKW